MAKVKKLADNNLLPLQEKSHVEIMRRCNFKNDHIIDPRLSSKTSLFSNVYDIPVESSNVVINADMIIIYGSFDFTDRYI